MQEAASSYTDLMVCAILECNPHYYREPKAYLSTLVLVDLPSLACVLPLRMLSHT